MRLDKALFDRAAAIAPGAALPGLDAIHVASAEVIAEDLRAVVTYDHRMAAAAITLGLPLEVPT
ncbi:MAG: hypothetical protein ACRD2W_13495 [Acidimicrobiales bacterium]